MKDLQAQAPTDREEQLRKRPLLLEAARSIEPYYHGQLDGLCGLYAVINALRLVALGYRAPLTTDGVEALFRTGAAWLDAKQSLCDAVGQGIGWRRWLKLVFMLSAAAGRDIGGEIFLQLPFKGVQDLTPGFFVCVAREAVRDRKAVLVLLRGRYNHFTVICGVSETRLRLFDSHGYRWINIKSFGPGAGGQPARHQVHIPSVLLVGG